MQVEITVIDVNDNYPEFSSTNPTYLTLNENNPAGMHIHTFSATDKDDPTTGNGVVRYFISGGNASVTNNKTGLLESRKR